MKIDCHTHFADAEKQKAICFESNTTRQITLHHGEVKDCRQINEAMAQLLSPGFGILPKENKEALKELLHVQRVLNLPGIQLSAQHEVSEELLSALEGVNLPIVIHPEAEDEIEAAVEGAMAAIRWLENKNFENHPKLRVLFAHGSSVLASILGLTEIEEPLPQFWIDSFVKDPLSLLFVIDRLGIDRVVLGSQWPIPGGEEGPGDLIEALRGLKPQLRDQLLHHNASAWLDLPVKQD